jgi:tetratricopeptide (TPR) repeat protein
MPRSPSNLPLALAALAAAASVLTLGGVLLWRARVLERSDADLGATPAAERRPAAPSRPAETTEKILDAADELVRRRELSRAESVLRAAVGEHPEDQELRLALAGVLVLSQRPAAAYEQYEAALAIGPRTAEVEFNAGTLASGLGRLDRAEEHFASAQATDPSDARFPLYLAQVQIAQGNTSEARRNLHLAARLDESLAVAWGTLAELSLRNAEPRVALQLIARARELEPDSAVWRLIEARALNRSGSPERALAVLGGIPAQQRDLSVLRLMGESFGLLGRPADAAQTFEAAARERPDDAELLLETAIWWERAGDPDRALSYARRAGELGSETGTRMAERLDRPDER